MVYLLYCFTYSDLPYQRRFAVSDGHIFCPYVIFCHEIRLSISLAFLLLFPGCFLGGAVFCLFCDLAARTVFAPTELSISSVTAVFGAPVVIYMMVHNRKGMQ